MCDCTRRRCGGWPCLCFCHGGPQLIGGTRAGKTFMLWVLAERARFRAEHPNGVVAGKVLERGPAPP